MNLTADPIPKLVRAIAIPASVGMFFQTMYNFVDTYFAGRESTEALAALTFSFPVFFLVLAFGSGLGQATTALIGHALGAQEVGRGKQIFCQ
jgi:Na+-driven multidrug efflux pump